MKLHENKTLFRQAVQFTADQMKIPAIYVEKDYWVTYALFTIFTHEIGKDTVFKGGTALSKCYQMIERFSEDIDLVVLRREGESNNMLTTKIRKISDIVSTVLPEVNIKGVTHKMGMNRKTAHAYNREFRGDFGQVRDAIVVESTWLGYHEPYTTKSIVSFVGQMMMDNNQSDFAKENGLLPFDLLVLEPIRTICEKIMSLVRFSYTENPIEDLKKKIRHTYDLHQLLQQAEFSKFLHSEAFDSMLLKVANDDVASFKNNNKWLIYHPNEALIFKNLENVWAELKTVYNGDFKNLLYGELPKEESVLEILKMIQERMKAISWTIKIEG
ncbi:nucleotidyl transferase AbiEii/AbiGii toxin family protein [Aquiflexum gelatinilyticum]|uniref:nucleotidyl transferase AbiEii/AbiGii toxin family protein n=1 Tax=Aquiflexum gelatinilyticum TaxID=2961943 RepID=UPI002167E03C|nr:nucleotidyl transferase AbiEii/AbiGii toxin family protein [Aquiflexum gelatinilyticum]MCS4436187.1 nucleotidyl transferase AbiEii/AbiGii toxin family protein [Aquiflexum gelatinilyticum]